MLKRVAIFSQDNSARTIDCVNQLIAEMRRRDTHVQVYSRSGEESLFSFSGTEIFSDLISLKELPDLVLSVGGDGTYLETMLMVRRFSIPVAGINTGRLGFLANISGEEVSTALNLLYEGGYHIIERSLLEVFSPKNLFGTSETLDRKSVVVGKSVDEGGGRII